MPDNNDIPENEREMENLSKAIVDAILSSSDVKEALEKLQKLDASTANSIMVFLVRLDSLSEISGNEVQKEKFIEEAMKLKPQKRRGRKKQASPPIIDGKIISKNEEKFLDYLSKNFDQAKWLKNNKLKIEGEEEEGSSS